VDDSTYAALKIVLVNVSGGISDEQATKISETSVFTPELHYLHYIELAK
jgi:hypothetical protein